MCLSVKKLGHKVRPQGGKRGKERGKREEVILVHDIAAKFVLFFYLLIPGNSQPISRLISIVIYQFLAKN